MPAEAQHLHKSRHGIWYYLAFRDPLLLTLGRTPSAMADPKPDTVPDPPWMTGLRRST
jgi:hypothetical protein